MSVLSIRWRPVHDVGTRHCHGGLLRSVRTGEEHRLLVRALVSAAGLGVAVLVWAAVTLGLEFAGFSGRISAGAAAVLGIDLLASWLFIARAGRSSLR